VLHFVDPNNDTISSLSLRYGVPADALRRTNKMYADHLLAARRTILIPGEFYKGGVSLSPRPLEGEEEEMKKTKLRKFMVTCKVSE
jgi:LysM repeat protein